MNSVLLKRWAPMAALVLVLAVFPLLGNRNLTTLGIYAMIYAIAAIGLSLLMGLAGQVSLGHAAFFAVGAYTFAILATRSPVPDIVAALIAIAVAMLVALGVGAILLRLKGHFLALATMGLGMIVATLAGEWEFTGGTSGIYGIQKPRFLGRTYDTPEEFFWLLAPFLVLSLVVALNLVHSRSGRALSAVNDSDIAAQCLGVHTYRLRLQVFVVSAGFAALAGVFYAYWLAVVSPEAAGIGLSIQFLLIVVLGGLRSVWGAVIGAVAVQLVEEVMRRTIPLFVPGAAGQVELLGFGLILIFIMVSLPGGLIELAGTVRRRLPLAEPAPLPAGPDGTTRVTMPPVSVPERIPERGSSILEVKNLVKRYGGVTAVNNVSFDVRAGEILALIGPNGAGKTTCFNMISGVVPPSEGTVTMSDRETTTMAPHGIALLGATRTFQNLQVFGSSTVLGNVQVGRHIRSRAGVLRGMLALNRTEEKQVRQDAQSVLDALGLGAEAPRPIRDLSFGRQRQVELARALALAPTLLMLDEPMAGLSATERSHLSTLLREIRSHGISVILVEHDVEAVMALADRVAVLDDGHLIALGEPEEVRHDEAVIAAYLGTDDSAQRAVDNATKELA